MIHVERSTANREMLGSPPPPAVDAGDHGMTMGRTQRVTMLVLAFVVLFIAPTSFRIRDYADKSLDLQTGLKLLGIGVSFLLPLGTMLSGQAKLAMRSGGVWLVFLLIVVASSVQSPVVGVSLIDSTAYLGCFLLCLWMVSTQGEVQAAWMLIVNAGLIAAISLIVYFVYPDLGRMHAWLGSEFGTNNRVSGIAGSPNGLGTMTSLALILLLMFLPRMNGTQRATALLGAPFCLLCLVMSDNRASMIALLLCGGVWYLSRRHAAGNFLIAGLAAATIALAISAAPDLVFSSLSRSGDATEISSGTGRAEIWTVVIEMIKQRPLTGHGYASASYILPLDPRLFSVAAHAHNMYLEVLFSCGIVGFAVLMVALVQSLWLGFRYEAHAALIIIFFFLLRGITEPAPFSGLPAYGGYAFLLAITIIGFRATRERDESRLIEDLQAEDLTNERRQRLAVAPIVLSRKSVLRTGRQDA